MKRKLYIKPSITTVEIEAMSIMAVLETWNRATAATVTSLHRATTSTPGSMMTTATKRMSINNTLQQRG